MVLPDCSKEQLLRSSVFTGKFLTVYLCKVYCFILHTLQLPSLIPVLLAFKLLGQKPASLKLRELMSISSFFFLFFFPFLMMPALSEYSSVLSLFGI